MGVSAFKYPDRFSLKNVTEEDFFSGLVYRKDNKVLISNPGGVGFSMPPNATSQSDEGTDIVLFEMSNGLAYILNYKCWVTHYTGGEQYHISAFIRVEDEDGTVVVQPVSVMGGSQNYDLTATAVPYEDCYFVPGRVTYSTNNPTIVGEEAVEVCFGYFYVLNVHQLLPV